MHIKANNGLDCNATAICKRSFKFHEENVGTTNVLEHKVDPIVDLKSC